MAMLPLTPKRHALLEGLTRTLSECRVFGLIIDLIGPVTEEAIQISQRPDCAPLRVHRFGQETRLFTCLGVAQQRVNELGIGGPKEPFHHGAKSGLGSGTDRK